MHQPFDKFLMFRNRLQKVYKHLSKAAARQGISCYRIYDHDQPEAPFLIELYEDKLYVSEYKRRHNLEEEAYEAWLHGCKLIMVEVIGVAYENIFLKLRQRKESRQGQYQKLDVSKTEFIVKERDLNFLVNLSDYLDTGLFLDHRITRGIVREMAAEKRVLNLFCYTGSFSVYAAAGGAVQVVSVDLSKTYLQWTERNMQLNFPEGQNHIAIATDATQYIKEAATSYFDIIILDPPTFSNSKRMEDFLDIQRDHVTLINNCLRLLKQGGTLFFSTNFTRFQLNVAALHAADIRDITKSTTPFDFAGKLQRYCFKITK
jgi:23S rRNA (cytosine1962-C5)-methyltransferase